MATPTAHALCSASASERWLHCTAAPRFEANFPNETSSYAEEGTLAHSFCELYGRTAFGQMTHNALEESLAELQLNPRYDPAMHRTADTYVQFLKEKAMEYEAPPVVLFELGVDLSDYIPEGRGTCDNVMVGGHVLRITDYKHGSGVAVSAKENSQMRLYALGALKFIRALFGDQITDVVMGIVQPRVREDVEEDRISVDDLLKWGEEYVKPRALSAFTGEGAVFDPGAHCRFCKGKAVCAARAQKYSAFEDFKDCVVKEKGKGVRLQPMGDDRGVLSPAEIADLLTLGKGLKKWYEDLCDYATQEILFGNGIPGYKVVVGVGNRVFTDEGKVKSILTKQAGLKTADLYKPKEFKSPAQIEDLIGKKAFANLALEDYVKRPPTGKPKLVTEDDKTPAYNSAAADFAGVANK